MENSGKIYAGSGDVPSWFVVQGDRWIGPMTVADVLERIDSGVLSWAHYAWREGEGGWRRLCDIPEFQVAVPQKPDPSLEKKIQEAEKSGRTKTPPAPPSEKPERSWFLYYNDSQFGPFSNSEIDRFLRIGKIHGRVHAWRDGMDNWKRLEDLEAFAEGVKESAKVRAALASQRQSPRAIAKSVPAGGDAAQKALDQRSAPRRPLVARILLASDQSVVVSVCRDVSIGGMQVLTDRVPGDPGMRLKMNVSPAGGELGGKIEPFVAEGVIVRILEDGRGFSFRFEKLPESAKRAIENYIASTD
jgi:hypothetical protein